MALFEAGRVCRKTVGNDAWKICVILEKVDGGFMVEGADGKKIKVAGAHLEPTRWVVNTKHVPQELSNLKLA